MKLVIQEFVSVQRNIMQVNYWLGRLQAKHNGDVSVKQEVCAMVARFIFVTAFMLWCAIAQADDCPDTLDYSFKKLGSNEVVHLCDELAGKVVLVVNTASKCGYTHQYDGLESLFEKFRDRGLVVVGFPSNDFGGQEPGTEKEIEKFCRMTYGVKFPMFEKTHVAEGLADKIYLHYASLAGEYPRWNFHKYLLNRDGVLVGSFASGTDPESDAIVNAIEELL